MVCQVSQDPEARTEQLTQARDREVVPTGLGRAGRWFPQSQGGTAAWPEPGQEDVPRNMEPSRCEHGMKVDQMRTSAQGRQG